MTRCHTHSCAFFIEIWQVVGYTPDVALYRSVPVKDIDITNLVPDGRVLAQLSGVGQAHVVGLDLDRGLCYDPSIGTLLIGEYDVGAVIKIERCTRTARVPNGNPGHGNRSERGM